jgi:hypothetical protein
MAPSSQRLEPPQNTGRFNQLEFLGFTHAFRKADVNHNSLDGLLQAGVFRNGS